MGRVSLVITSAQEKWAEKALSRCGLDILRLQLLIWLDEVTHFTRNELTRSTRFS